MSGEQQKRLIAELSDESGRTIVVLGLQALWRERVTAWKCACTFAFSAGIPPPESTQFGIDDVGALLRRIGAAPQL